MCQPSLSVWFVCRLCRGSFGQVDAFIEHKKQKHFTQFQNTTSIVFEERELGELCPVIIKTDHQLLDESDNPPIKIEVNDVNSTNTFSSAVVDELNLDLVEPKSELITYESEINPGNENNFFGLKQPEQNPFVHLKRLTSEEIQSACVPQHHSSLLKFEQKVFVSKLEPPSLSAEVDSNIRDFIEVEESTENPPSVTGTNISTAEDRQFECKLCSKQLQSDAQLKIHVGICALYHEDQSRFCVTCNRKFSTPQNLKTHRLRFHGTEEEKLSLLKFKCHVCPKKYRLSIDLRLHLETHKKKTQQVKTSKSNSLKCLHPNCGKEFRCNSNLQRHLVAHFGARPFSCHFPNCNKTFSQKGNFNVHLRIHTGERPFQCTVDNCNEAFIDSRRRSVHHQIVHSNE